jgi:hypothetical protein
MEDQRPPRRGLLIAIAFAPILLAAVLWLPGWWEKRTYREMESIAGVEARIVPGTLAEARGKVNPGLAADAVAAAIGKPSLSVRTEGKDSSREIWTYYFADGTMQINLTDGLVQRVSAAFGPPRIPTSARP